MPEDTLAMKQAKELYKVYSLLNAALFEGELPNRVLLRYAHNPRTDGTFRADAWDTDNDEAIPEITLSQHLIADNPEELLVNLVHQMTHLWQHSVMKVNKAYHYHDQTFAEKLEEMGLIPFSTKDEDSKTGFSISHRVDPTGRFSKDAGRMGAALKQSIKPRGSAIFADSTDEKPNRNKVTWVCPKCEQKAWGSPKLEITCSRCKVRFKKQ